LTEKGEEGRYTGRKNKERKIYQGNLNENLNITDKLHRKLAQNERNE
jgi:hypothetical protein